MLLVSRHGEASRPGDNVIEDSLLLAVPRGGSSHARGREGSGAYGETSGLVRRQRGPEKNMGKTFIVWFSRKELAKQEKA